MKKLLLSAILAICASVNVGILPLSEEDKAWKARVEKVLPLYKIYYELVKSRRFAEMNSFIFLTMSPEQQQVIKEDIMDHRHSCTFPETAFVPFRPRRCSELGKLLASVGDQPTHYMKSIGTDEEGRDVAIDVPRWNQQEANTLKKQSRGWGIF